MKAELNVYGSNLLRIFFLYHFHTKQRKIYWIKFFKCCFAVFTFLVWSHDWGSHMTEYLLSWNKNRGNLDNWRTLWKIKCVNIMCILFKILNWKATCTKKKKNSLYMFIYSTIIITAHFSDKIWYAISDIFLGCRKSYIRIKLLTLSLKSYPAWYTRTDKQLIHFHSFQIFLALYFKIYMVKPVTKKFVLCIRCNFYLCFMTLLLIVWSKR